MKGLARRQPWAHAMTAEAGSGTVLPVPYSWSSTRTQTAASASHARGFTTRWLRKLVKADHDGSRLNQHSLWQNAS
jgi:hypothetical protein